MHKSRFAGFIIECNTDNLDGAAAFRGVALDYRLERNERPPGELYTMLETGRDDLHVEVQKVGQASRVHLDIETDNIETEVACIETLGAKRTAQTKTWWVMEAPTGHRFRVVNPIGEGAAGDYDSWE